MKNLIFKNFDKETREINKLFNNLDVNKLVNFRRLCETSIKGIKNGNKILFFGNGGSAADAQHLATELKVKYKKKRRALPAIALSNDISSITAIGNDYNYKYIFSRQIESIGKKGDIAIALTTSGNSKNLIEAAKTSNKMKIKTFCFSGNNGGMLKNSTKYPILIPSKSTSAIQVCELFLGQLYCGILEEFFLKKK